MSRKGVFAGIVMVPALLASFPVSASAQASYWVTIRVVSEANHKPLRKADLRFWNADDATYGAGVPGFKAGVKDGGIKGIQELAFSLPGDLHPREGYGVCLWDGLAVISVAPGVYTAMVSHPGHVTASQTITVPPPGFTGGYRVEHTIPMKVKPDNAPRRLAVTVRGERAGAQGAGSPAPIAGAGVIVRAEDGFGAQRTDGLGEVAFDVPRPSSGTWSG